MPGKLIDRHLRSTVVEALSEARAVCLLGARQSGKSTLARAIAAREHPAEYLTLDDDATRRAALEDPTGFIARVTGPAVIDGQPSLFHYRDKQQREADIVLELGSGEVAGVEIKTAAGVQAKDFAGLRHLRDQLGTRFTAGVVLYTGRRTLSFGERLAAVPLCGLWA